MCPVLQNVVAKSQMPVTVRRRPTYISPAASYRIYVYCTLPKAHHPLMFTAVMGGQAVDPDAVYPVAPLI